MARLSEKGRLCDGLGLTALLALAALFMWPAWQQPDGLWYAPRAEFSDLTVTHWPNMWFVAQVFRQQGQIPLWRPLIMGGAPLVGNPLAALFYPPNWLFLFLPTTPTFHLQIALHLFGAGAALYGVARWSYGCSAFSSFLGGLGYMLTPKLIAHLGAGHIGLCQAFAWLPVVVWLLRGAVERRSARRAAWCGVALAVVYLADPRVAFYGALTLGCYAVYRLGFLWQTQGWRQAAHLGLRLLSVPLCLALVGAVQIAPTAELLTMTTRAELTLEEAGRDSLPWRYLFGYVVADRGGYHEWMTYLGLPMLGLALLGVGLSRERDRWFWAALGLLCVAFSLGTNAFLYPFLYRLLPGLGWLRVPPRALLLTAMAASLLAALGTDALFRAEWPASVRRWIVLGSFAGMVLCVGIGLGFGLLLGRRMPAGLTAFAAVGAGFVVALLLSAQPHVPPVGPQVLLAIVATLDLWSVGRTLGVVRPPEQVFAEGSAVAAHLGGLEGHFRVYSPSYSIPQHVGAYHGVEQLDGVDPSQLSWVRAFMGAAGGYRVAGYGVTIPYFPDGVDVHTAWRDAVPDAALLGLLNGRFIAAEYPVDAPGLTSAGRLGSTFLYENERVLPRAFTVTYVEPTPSWQKAQDHLRTGFDPASGALIEGGVALRGARGWRPAQVSSFSPNRVVVVADVPSPSLLVLSEVWYPGWKVTVDEAEQPYYRVNGIVRGVYLDPGRHTVEWRYQPSSLRWGIGIALCALLALVVVEVVVRARWAPRAVVQ